MRDEGPYLPDPTPLLPELPLADPLAHLLQQHACEVDYDGACMGCTCGPGRIAIRDGKADAHDHTWHAAHQAEQLRADAVRTHRELRTVVGREVELHLASATRTRRPVSAWVQSLTTSDGHEPHDHHELVLWVGDDVAPELTVRRDRL